METSELTGRILAACFDVSNELGSGSVESVYQRALMMTLAEDGLGVQVQAPMKVHFRGHIVGEFLADLVVENQVIIELKAVATLLPEHRAQLINYLYASGIETGLLVNFGRPHIEYKRCRRPTASQRAYAGRLVTQMTRGRRLTGRDVAESE